VDNLTSIDKQGERWLVGEIVDADAPLKRTDRRLEHDARIETICCRPRNAMQ
jgi:hypothetical protein